MFKRQECSPLEQNNEYSCLDDDLILDVTKVFNAKMKANIDSHSARKTCEIV